MLSRVLALVVAIVFPGGTLPAQAPIAIVTEVVYNPDYGFPSVLATDTAYDWTAGHFRYRVVRFRPIP